MKIHRVQFYGVSTLNAIFSAQCLVIPIRRILIVLVCAENQTRTLKGDVQYVYYLCGISAVDGILYSH